MISVRATQASDIIEASKVAKVFYDSDAALLASVHSNLERSFTAIDSDGNIGMLFGYNQVFTGVLEVWTVTTIHFDKYKLSYIKFIKDKLAEGLEQPNIFRIQIYVKEKFPHLHRWAEFLGFSYEGRHPKMDGRDTYLSYGRVK